jgi:hypothetical protein
LCSLDWIRALVMPSSWASGLGSEQGPISILEERAWIGVGSRGDFERRTWIGVGSGLDFEGRTWIEVGPGLDFEEQTWIEVGPELDFRG